MTKEEWEILQNSKKKQYKYIPTEKPGEVSKVEIKGDYPKERQGVINQLSNLPIYSPDIRYADYQKDLLQWKKNVENVPIKENPGFGSTINREGATGSYFDKNTPNSSKEYPYKGTIQLDPNNYNPIDTKERLIRHEATHAAFDDSKGSVPNWLSNSLGNTQRLSGMMNTKDKNYTDDQSERLVQAMGIRNDIVKKFGLNSNQKIPRDLYNSYLKDYMYSSIRTGENITPGELQSSLSSSRNATDLYNLLNMENIQKKEKK
jgi:hypothetical protein